MEHTATLAARIGSAVEAIVMPAVTCQVSLETYLRLAARGKGKFSQWRPTKYVQK